ncbi:nucleotidyltransferase family protein [soil metagenome]
MHITENCCGILLAAGQGRRFDASGRRNKLLQLLPSGVSVACRSAQTLLAVLPCSLAVVPAHPNSDELAQVLAATGCQITRYQSAVAIGSAVAQEGMANSLVHALRQTPASCTGWVIALADMPYVQAETIAAIVLALQGGAGIAVPLYQGRRGNPVGFSRQYLPQLLALQGDQGARGLLKSLPVTEVEVTDAGIFRDIDVREDLL